MIAQVVRLQQRRDRLRQPRDVLGDVDQCDREVARGMQDGKAERADQHHVARGGGAALPQRDGPASSAMVNMTVNPACRMRSFSR